MTPAQMTALWAFVNALQGETLDETFVLRQGASAVMFKIEEMLDLNGESQ